MCEQLSIIGYIEEMQYLEKIKKQFTTDIINDHALQKDHSNILNTVQMLIVQELLCIVMGENLGNKII